MLNISPDIVNSILNIVMPLFCIWIIGIIVLILPLFDSEFRESLSDEYIVKYYYRTILWPVVFIIDLFKEFMSIFKE